MSPSDLDLAMLDQVVKPRRHDLIASFNYFSSATAEAPYHYISADPPLGVPRHNLSCDAYEVLVQDVRGNEQALILDKTGFTFARHVSVEKEFLDEEKIREVYYPEMAEFIKREIGAERVFVMEHTVRRQYDGKNGLHTNAPVHRVHVDQSFEAAIKRVHRHMGEEAPVLLQSRVRILNVWRPIGNPVTNNPLAFLDARSLDGDYSKIVPITFYFKDRVGEVGSLGYNPSHRWYYLSGQEPEEIAMFKCYDSNEEEGMARCCPHSAFNDPNTPVGAPPRESIEIRALVFGG